MIRKTILWQALILIICALVVSGCSGKKPQTTGAGESNLLATIKSAGVIHVGTMASNAPWVYKDEKDNYVGYDMDLIQEIARRLGVKVEITDMSFDALLAAVQTGKVDVGICSIGAKEERKKMVDFSQMYHQALNTFAARNDSSIIINSADDIVNYHVGALSGSL
jgi:polar amino acid transport system substrate-binding protein